MPLSKLSGVVLVVDPAALASGPFADVARMPIATMADRDDFCVFPWLRDVTIDELKNLAIQGNPLAVSLVENTHLDVSMESLPGLLVTIGDYLKNGEMLRALGRFQRASLAVTRIAGYIAQGLSYMAVVGAIAVPAIAASTIHVGFPRTDGLIREASVILVGAAIVILYLRLRRLSGILRSSADLLKGYPLVGLELLALGAAGLFVCWAAAPLVSGLRMGTFFVGIGVGVMLVALVREGRRTRIQTLSFAELPKAIDGGTILTRLYDGMAEIEGNTGIPLFEPVFKRVFISYARSSVWSSDIAGEVATRLRKMGAYVFLDRLSLRPGLSWKRQVRWAIDNSNVFIAVLDEAASEREWVAAEFTSAYYNKMVRGAPEIFIVHPKDINWAHSKSPAGAFFAKLIVEPCRAVPERMRFKLAGYDPGSCDKMCSAIRRLPIAGELGALGNILISLIVGPAVSLVGSATLLLGIPLVVMYLLWALGLVSPGAYLSENPQLFLPVALALSLLGGFSLRLAIRALTEIRRADYSYAPGHIEAIETIAFFTGVVFCIPWLSLTGVCLAVVTVYLGIQLGRIFAISMRTWKASST